MSAGTSRVASPSAAKDRAARRARREERRARQRAQNVVRARQMHVARVAHEASTASTIRGSDSTPVSRDGKKLQIYVGCSGWYYWHWANAFYPAELPRHRWFSHYARRF